MAKVYAYSGADAKDLELKSGENYKDHSRRSDAVMAKLEAESDAAAKAGKVVGLIYRHPMGDGQAVYRVTKEKPLELEHIPYGDAYALPEAHERGLRLQDILTYQKSLAGMRSIFRAGDEPAAEPGN